MLGIDELYEISSTVQSVIADRLDEILAKLNRTGQIEEFLSLIGMSDLLGSTNEVSTNINGTILVVGYSTVEEGVLAGIAKSLGIDKSRFEFHLEYDAPKTFNFYKTQWSNEYSVILVGPMPHSGQAKGEYSSIITALERQEGYPPVVRVGTNELKITKSSFRDTLEYLIDNKMVA